MSRNDKYPDLYRGFEAGYNRTVVLIQRIFVRFVLKIERNILIISFIKA
jgi:hypothetical protein